MLRKMTVLAAAAALFSGCGVDAEPQPGPGEFKADYATNSLFFTRMSAPVRGASVHGTVRIWYSSNVKDLITQSSFTVPVGTTSVKEADPNNDGTVDTVYVMVKREAGYDSANNDWYYEVRNPQGVLQSSPAPGKIAGCINCHKDLAQTDYLGGTKM
jgi:hypothetical protein